MNLINGKIRLSDLAHRLGVTNQSLRNHLKNGSGLGVGAAKFGAEVTSDYLLSIDSVINYLEWSFTHSKKLKFNTISDVLKEVLELKIPD